MQDEKAEDFVLDQVSLYCNAQAISLDPLHCLWDTVTFLKSVSAWLYDGKMLIITFIEMGSVQKYILHTRAHVHTHCPGVPKLILKVWDMIISQELFLVKI